LQARRPRGFTLIEVVVVIAIASITMMGAVTMLGNIHARNLDNANLQKAEMLARSTMEKYVINTWPLANVPLTTDPATGFSYRVRRNPLVTADFVVKAQVDIFLPAATQSCLTLLTAVRK
jgi:prepilin-type N-terminal cleavage/methylation domain-containing protein